MKHKGTDIDWEPFHDQSPPPNEALLQNAAHTEGIRVHDDGCISIDASSRLCRALSRLLPNDPRQSSVPPPPSYETLGETPPRFNLNIVIQIVGSRGDVQPFIALGTDLHKIGHRVRIATHNVFQQFVSQAGLDFYPIGGDPADLMLYMVKHPGLVPSMHSLRGGDIQKNRLIMAEILHGCWQSCLMPDPVTNAPFVANAIIANPLKQDLLNATFCRCFQPVGHIKMATEVIAYPNYQPSLIHTDNKRWDPITGISSAGMGMTFEILKAGGDIIYQPYKVYKNGATKTTPLSSQPQIVSSQLHSPTPINLEEYSTSLRKARSLNDLTRTSESETKEKRKALDMAAASARAGGKFLGKCVSGVMVDVPLAAAEGFRVLPGLYGDKVYEHQKVKGWKSGAMAGAKGFAIGIGESLIDPFYQPYMGARDGGIRCFTGGIFKGTFGVIAKMTHASLGLVAYPGQGIKRSIQVSLNESTRKLIVSSIHEDGRYLAQEWRLNGF